MTASKPSRGTRQPDAPPESEDETAVETITSMASEHAARTMTRLGAVSLREGARLRGTWFTRQTYRDLGLACALAEHFGLEVMDDWHRMHPCSRNFAWDGERLWAEYDASNTIHDIAHWLCSTPTRRKLPEFGLGTNPGCWAPATRVMPLERSFSEESRASAVGIVAERELGMDWERTYSEHGWEPGRRGGTCAAFNRIARSATARKMIEACRAVLNTQPPTTV